jgi:hypothetical protein
VIGSQSSLFVKRSNAGSVIGLFQRIQLVSCCIGIGSSSDTTTAILVNCVPTGTNPHISRLNVIVAPLHGARSPIFHVNICPTQVYVPTEGTTLVIAVNTWSYVSVILTLWATSSPKFVTSIIYGTKSPATYGHDDWTILLILTSDHVSITHSVSLVHVGPFGEVNVSTHDDATQPSYKQLPSLVVADAS